MYASNHIVRQTRTRNYQFQRLNGTFKTFWVVPQPIMIIFQTVQTDGNTAHSRRNQFSVHCLIVSVAVGNDSPTETVLPQCFTTFCQIFADKRFAAHNDNKYGISRIVFFQRLNGVKKILKRHIGKTAVRLAIRPAMLTFQIATPCTFPKQIIENVKFSFVFAKDVVDGFGEEVVHI